MKKNCLLILFLILGFKISAQSSSYSLEQAVQYALENNTMSKNATNDLEIAQAKKWETIATGLPQLSAFLDYANNIKQPISLVPAEFFCGNRGEFAEISFGTKQTFDGTATLNQLLFDGSYMVGLSSIKLYLEIADNAKTKTDLEVKRNVISAYGNVLVSEERVNYACSKILEAKFKLGLFENRYVDEDNISEKIFNKSHKDLALELAREGIVLLKNDYVLPLHKAKKVKNKILVTGPNANNQSILGDWHNPQPDENVFTIYEGIEKIGSEMGYLVNYHNSNENI